MNWRPRRHRYWECRSTERVEAGNALNEFGWWARWARPFTPFRGAFGLTSREFDEPLFNRVIFLDPPASPKRAVEEALAKFNSRGAKPSFFVEESPSYASAREAVEGAGLRRTGRFLILQKRKPSSETKSIEVRKSLRKDLDSWAQAYIEAFYGRRGPLDEVSRCAKRAIADGKNSLLLAESDGVPAGTAAIRLEAGYLGVYCVGTVPKMRRRGVAGSLLAYAERTASEAGVTTILQVFENDEVESYYTKRGFRRAFSEEIFTGPDG